MNKTKNDLEMLKAELAKIEPLKKEKEEELRSAEKRLNRKLQNALKVCLINLLFSLLKINFRRRWLWVILSSSLNPKRTSLQ